MLFSFADSHVLYRDSRDVNDDYIKVYDLCITDILPGKTRKMFAPVLKINGDWAATKSDNNLSILNLIDDSEEHNIRVHGVADFVLESERGQLYYSTESALCQLDLSSKRTFVFHYGKRHLPKMFNVFENFKCLITYFL